MLIFLSPLIIVGLAGCAEVYRGDVYVPAEPGNPWILTSSVRSPSGYPPNSVFLLEDFSSSLDSSVKGGQISIDLFITGDSELIWLKGMYSDFKVELSGKSATISLPDGVYAVRIYGRGSLTVEARIDLSRVSRDVLSEVEKSRPCIEIIDSL